MMTQCPQCDRQARVSEPYAFRGMDRLRATLSCGHVVLRADMQACSTCGTLVERNGRNELLHVDRMQHAHDHAVTL